MYWDEYKCDWRCPVEPSTVPNTCTHMYWRNSNSSAVAFCQEQTTQASCNVHSSSCHWNQDQEVPPSNMTNTCTHSWNDTTNQYMVSLCMNVTDRKTCQEDGCQWNYCTPDASIPQPECGNTQDVSYWSVDSCSWECPKPLFSSSFCYPTDESARNFSSSANEW